MHTTETSEGRMLLDKEEGDSDSGYAGEGRESKEGS